MDDEEFCPGCDSGMGDWTPAATAKKCMKCKEWTCPDHHKPRQHGCKETRAIMELDQ